MQIQRDKRDKVYDLMISVGCTITLLAWAGIWLAKAGL
jgi:hypothetical protein